ACFFGGSPATSGHAVNKRRPPRPAEDPRRHDDHALALLSEVGRPAGAGLPLSVWRVGARRVLVREILALANRVTADGVLSTALECRAADLRGRRVRETDQVARDGVRDDFGGVEDSY